MAFFWTGFFVLEGFDFGVGALHKVVGRTDTERRVAINTIGPVWDGNEVWLVVAGASMFAAFPPWYATWFSALYLALWLLLAALILRGVSFEFRGKFDRPGWRSTWSWTLTIGSVLAPLLFGVGLGDLLAGLPIDAERQLHRQLPGPADRRTGCSLGADPAGPVPAARGVVPVHPQHRRGPGPGPGSSPAGCAFPPPRWCRLRGVDLRWLARPGGLAAVAAVSRPGRRRDRRASPLVVGAGPAAGRSPRRR